MKWFRVTTESSKSNFNLFIFIKNIYLKVVYVYFYENIFEDKSIYMIFHISKALFSCWGEIFWVL